MNAEDLPENVMVDKHGRMWALGAFVPWGWLSHRAGQGWLDGRDLARSCLYQVRPPDTSDKEAPSEVSELSHGYLNVERCPQTLGDAMRLIGRYTESEGGNSAETRQARCDLFDAYETWCHLDRPETEYPALTDDQRAKFEAAAERGLAARRAAAAVPVVPEEPAVEWHCEGDAVGIYWEGICSPGNPVHSSPCGPIPPAPVADVEPQPAPLDVLAMPEWAALVQAINDDSGTVANYRANVTGKASSLVRAARSAAGGES